MRTGFGTRGSAVALAAVAAVAVAAVGCGSSSAGGGGGGGSFTTSVSGDKPLSSLTDTDKTQLCKDIESYFKSGTIVAAQCKLAGVLVAALSAAFDPSVTDATLQASCAMAVDSCKNGGGDAGVAGLAAGSSETCDSAKSAGADCTATVAEFSACASDIPHAFDSIPTCSNLTRASLSSDGGADQTSITPQTAACMTFEMKCPSASQ